MVRVTQVRQHMPPSHYHHSNSPDKLKNENHCAPLVTEETIRTLGVGDYFGEQALFLGLNQNDTFIGDSSTAIRTANVISEDCECLVLDHVNFFSLIGHLNEIRFVS